MPSASLKSQLQSATNIGRECISRALQASLLNRMNLAALRSPNQPLSVNYRRCCPVRVGSCRHPYENLDVGGYKRVMV
jgi:hypothetical protein